MTHEDAGHYAKKHPGAELEEKIALRLRGKIANNSITCAEAHRIAGDLNEAPADVGTAVDLLEARIKKCQLGLFGYEKKKITTRPVDSISSEIRQSIEKALVDGRLPCAAAWRISENYKVAKIEIAAVCEKIKIKICSCQLGAFD